LLSRYFLRNTTKSYLKLIFYDCSCKFIEYNFIYFIPFFKAFVNYYKIPFKKELTEDGQIVEVVTINLSNIDITLDDFKHLFKYIAILPSFTYLNGKNLKLEEIDENNYQDVVTVTNLFLNKEYNDLRNISNNDLKNLFHLSSFLAIKPLISVFLNTIAIRIYEKLISTKLNKKSEHLKGKENFAIFLTWFWENFFQLENSLYFKQFDIPLIYYEEFKVYIYLYHLEGKSCFYFSINDFLALYGKNETIDSRFKKHKNIVITSFYGINKMKQQDTLYLVNELLLDPTLDFYKIQKPFQHFLNLTSLKIINNLLINIPTDFFEGLTKLEQLDLTKNLLKELKEHHFEPIKNTLESLNLSSNLLNSSNISLKNLKNLKYLDLSGNNFKEISYDIFNTLQNLEKLGLYNCKIEKLQENSFENLKKLKKLVLSYNKISKLPETIFNNLTSLEELLLNQNNFHKLPLNIFKGLHNLKYLNLASTPFATSMLLKNNYNFFKTRSYIITMYNLPAEINIVL